MRRNLMAQNDEIILKNLKDIQSLRAFLISELTLIDPEQEEVNATLVVRNTAPVSQDLGDVVFVGIGLRIISGKDNGNPHGSKYWPSRITKAKPSDNSELRQRYGEGIWYGGSNGHFPETTSAENSLGDVLFPGENIIYKLKIPKADLPYLDIRVEGSVSRRHLL